jgi:hypothetical protein
MEMPSGGIGRGPVLLMIGALPVVTTGEHLFQTSAGQVVDSQLRDGNEKNLAKFTAVNLSVILLLIYYLVFHNLLCLV